MALDPELVSQITTIGFPIVAFLLVYYDLRKKVEELAKAIQTLSERIASE